MNLDGYLPAMNKGQGKRKKNTDDTRLHFIYKLYSSFSFLFLHGEEGDHQLEAYKKSVMLFLLAPFMVRWFWKQMFIILHDITSCGRITPPIY